MFTIVFFLICDFLSFLPSRRSNNFIILYWSYSEQVYNTVNDFFFGDTHQGNTATHRLRTTDRIIMYARKAFVKHGDRRRNKDDTYYYYYAYFIILWNYYYYKSKAIMIRVSCAVWCGAADRPSRGITGRRRSNRIKIRTFGLSAFWGWRIYIYVYLADK